MPDMSPPPPPRQKFNSNMDIEEDLKSHNNAA